MLIAFGTALIGLLYIYVGYPILLRTVVRLGGVRPVRAADVTPALSLVVSAYNEAGVIRRKLENILTLDYPRDLVEVVVVSDASTDGTDQIVAEYAPRGVRLRREPDRKGKTAGLNRTIPQLRGAIVVFSDANALYARDALRQLVRFFADPTVGCVTGETRYVVGHSMADAGERAYWGYESRIKRLETAIGSTVGGDGAFYAIRRSLWRTLPDNAINDFLNPLQIVEAGWRAVYAPEAVAFEETAGGIRAEYRRRIRIVSRSWRAVGQARGALNPFRVGFFAVALLSHKVLRWFSGALLAVLVAGAAPFIWRWAAWLTPEQRGLAGVVSCLALATPPGRRVAALGVYFSAISLASLVGVAKGMTGRVSGIWVPARTGALQSPARSDDQFRTQVVEDAASSGPPSG